MCLHVGDSKPTSTIQIWRFKDLEPIRFVVALFLEVFRVFVYVTQIHQFFFTVHLKHTSGVTSTSTKSGVPQGPRLGPETVFSPRKTMFSCVLLINGTACFFNSLPYGSWAPFTTRHNIRKKNIRTSCAAALTHTHTPNLTHT